MPSKFKQLLESIAREKAPGPSITFSVLHMLRAMELIAEKTVGRSRLSEELKVGEGAVRTIIGRLKSSGLITTSKMGCALTSKGLKIWNEYKLIFRKKVEIEKGELMPANFNIAILVKNYGHKAKSGIEQRDAAIKVGAKGATTIIFKEGRLIIPSVSNDAAKDFPNIANQIIKLLQPEENDVIVIGSADSLDTAEYGTMAATWALLGDC